MPGPPRELPLLPCDPPPPASEEQAKAIVLESKTWTRIRPRLVLFATRNVPRHRDPEDPVQDAMAQIHLWAKTGTGRRWNYEAEPSLTRSMLWIVASVISNEQDSAHERHHGGSIHRDDDEEDLEPTEQPWGAPVPDRSPEAMLEQGALWERGFSHIARVEQRLDSVALAVFRGIQSGRYEPTEIARELDVPADAIYVAYKRVKHHIQAVTKEDQEPTSRAASRGGRS